MASSFATVHRRRRSSRAVETAAGADCSETRVSGGGDAFRVAHKSRASPGRLAQPGIRQSRNGANRQTGSGLPPKSRKAAMNRTHYKAAAPRCRATVGSSAWFRAFGTKLANHEIHETRLWRGRCADAVGDPEPWPASSSGTMHLLT